LTAAIYSARAGCDVTVFEGMSPGGQVMTTPDIENFPGFVGTGFDLASKMYEQAMSHNIGFEYDNVKSIEKTDGFFKILCESGRLYEAKAVIISSGAKRRLLGVPGETEFTGRGVSYCATCDGNFFRGKTVAVVGGGNTAVEDALYLANICHKVYLIHRRDEFRAAKVLTERLPQKDNIETVLNAVPVEIKGDTKVTKIVVKDKINDTSREIETDAVFIAVGTIPETSFVPKEVLLDNGGYIITDKYCMTNVDGIFAVGDVRDTPLKQVITAAADGAIAATFASEYIRK